MSREADTNDGDPEESLERGQSAELTRGDRRAEPGTVGASGDSAKGPVNSELTRDDRGGWPPTDAEGPSIVETGDDRHEDEETRNDQQGSAPVALPLSLASRYRRLEQIGDGGQGVVVRAQDLRTGEAVAIKLYARARRSRDAIERIRGAELREHVAQLIEVGGEAGVSWEVMEYLPLGSLEDLLAREGLPSADEALAILRELASALRAIHGTDTTHQDVKPSNVLVRTRNPLDLVLADFGALREQVHTRDYSRGMMFTDRYAAPEADYEVSPAVDWWCLGIIMAELVTGRHPWATPNGVVPPGVRGLMRNEPPRLDGFDERTRLLCRGLLAVDSERRWGGEQVAAWLRGESPTVCSGVRRPAAVRVPLVLETGEFTEPAAFAGALAGEPAVWDEVYACLRDRDSPARRRLRAWLVDWDRDDLARILDEAELSGGRLASALCVRLLRGVEPRAPASFAGRPADRGGLLALAHAAEAELRDLDPRENPTTGNAPSDAIIGKLSEAGVMQEVSALEGGEGLHRLEKSWESLVRQYRQRVSQRLQVSELPLALTGDKAVHLARARLLAALLDAPTAARVHAAGQAARRDRLARQAAWFAPWADESPQTGELGLPLDLVLNETVGLARDDAKRNRRAASEAARAGAEARSAAAARRASAWILPLSAVGLVALAVPWAVVGLGIGFRTEDAAIPGLVLVLIAIGLLMLALSAATDRTGPQYVRLVVFGCAIALLMLLLFDLEVVSRLRLPRIPDGPFT